VVPVAFLLVGQWGVDIFEGDSPEDLRDLFQQQLAAGLTVEEASVRAVVAFGEFFDTDPNLLFALAELQMQHGRLQPAIYHRALRALDGKADEQMGWKPELLDQRQEVLRGFRERLARQRPRRRLVSRVSEVFYS
jgi:hypothetical protein